jgi:hypothetical protein
MLASPEVLKFHARGLEEWIFPVKAGTNFSKRGLAAAW